MEFIDIRLPTDISANAIGGPEFFTTVNTSKGQGEFRNVNWNYPRYRYNVGYGIKDHRQIMQIVSLFNICKGKGSSFRYKDWMDFQTKDELLGEGDGRKTTYPLQKNYSLDGYFATRRITKPVINTAKIYVDGKLSSNSSVDYTIGMITFAIPPVAKSKISASFEFDIQVRFDNDFLPVKIMNQHHYVLEDVSLIEVKNI